MQFSSDIYGDILPHEFISQLSVKLPFSTRTQIDANSITGFMDITKVVYLLTQQCRKRESLLFHAHPLTPSFTLCSNPNLNLEGLTSKAVAVVSDTIFDM